MEAFLSLLGKVTSVFKRRPAPPKVASVGARQAQSSVPAFLEARRDRSEGVLPRFQTMASDQPYAGGGDKMASFRSRLRQAFTPSHPVADGRMFSGRQALLRTIIGAIENQRLHVVLYGERGIGKTSLLHMLRSAATDARYLVVYTSCGALSSFDEIFRGAAADIPLLYHSGFAPNESEAERGSSLLDLLPTTQISPRVFGDLCAKLTGTRVLIILDEFDQCESAAFRRDIAELIKTLSDRLGRVQLVLSGVAGDLSDLVEHIPSIRRNIFAQHVEKMSDAEIASIVSNGERETTMTFEPTATAFVVAASRGSPYLANLICHHAGHAALNQQRTTVKPADVAQAVEQAVEEFAGRVSKPLVARVARLMDGNGGAIAAAARAALAADGTFTLQELVTDQELEAKRAQQVIALLKEEGLLREIQNDDTANYRFLDDGLPAFIWMSWARDGLEAIPAVPPTARKATSTGATA